MKVKEIVEILKSNDIEKEVDDVLEDLDDIDIEADENSEIDASIVKKLEKLYKTTLKPKKEPKQIKTPEPTNKRSETEKPTEAKFEANTSQKNNQNNEEAQNLGANLDNQNTNKKNDEKSNINKQKNNDEKSQKNEKFDLNNKEGKKSEEKSAQNKASDNKVEAKKTQNNYSVEDEALENLEKQGLYEEKYDDLNQDKNKYKRIKNIKKKQNKQTNDRRANSPIQKSENEQILYYSDGMTVAKVADSLGKGMSEIVKKLFSLGQFASASDVLERDIIEILADEYGFEIKNEINDDITKFEEMDILDNPDELEERPPIVTIMGHVDHGKTTLLDTIRNSKVVATEAGGITQAIGAYQVRKNGKLITFIDTPGHAAFTEMRARGANLTDIVILVVAADDGVMPQTKEAVEHAKAAGVPIIVAVNKMDKVGANPDRVKQELANLDLLCEDWGGKTIFVPISALKGDGVEELLEMVLLEAEMNEYKANPNRLGLGSVIEAKLDKGKGPVATLLVKNGTLKVGDPVVVGNTWGKVRAMTDETNANIKVALPSKAVEITGLTDVPNAGDRFMVFQDEKTARLVCEERKIRTQNESMSSTSISLASLFGDNEEVKELNLLVKGDVQGSIEALANSLSKLEVSGVKVNIVRSAVGAITETDISLAIVSKAIIIAFNVRSNSKILDLAKEKGIEVRYYDIIYKLLEDIEAAMKGLLDPVYEEKTIGEAIVRQTYKVSKVGTVAGCYVTNGMVERNAGVRLIRNSIVVYTGKLSSLKRFTDDVKEVNQGFECGITIQNFNDIKVDDMLEFFKMEEVND